MVVRQRGDRTQIAVLEDGILVEHYVTGELLGTAGNVYLGKVQNVLPSMEAAFVDIGRGRNAVLYAGEVNWDAAGLEGRARSIEQALKSGDNGAGAGHQGPDRAQGRPADQPDRLPGRHLVYVPNGNASGISRKLPGHRAQAAARHPQEARARRRRRDRPDRRRGGERGGAGPRRRAAAGAVGGHPGQGGADQVARPALLYAEPDLVIRVVRDLFNEDFTRAGRPGRRRLRDGRASTSTTSRRTWSPGCAGTTGDGDVVRRVRASTSRSSRRWTARSTCPPAARW